MKLTIKQLKQLIRESVQNILKEQQQITPADKEDLKTAIKEIPADHPLLTRLENEIRKQRGMQEGLGSDLGNLAVIGVDKAIELLQNPDMIIKPELLSGLAGIIIAAGLAGMIGSGSESDEERSKAAKRREDQRKRLFRIS